MLCPACNHSLTSVETGGVTVDACDGGCGGLWFDNFELKKFDEPLESEGESLLHIQRNPGVQVNPEERRPCPKCADITLRRHFFSVKRKVELDECGMCGGVWLDAGELAGIRDLYNTEAERKKAAADYFSELFDDDLKTVKEKSQEELAKTRRFANMFKFITPSYYIPGHQKWGAF